MVQNSPAEPAQNSPAEPAEGDRRARRRITSTALAAHGRRLTVGAHDSGPSWSSPSNLKPAGAAQWLAERAGGPGAVVVARDKAWPRTAKGMASALARIAPALVGHGIRAERLPRNHGKRGWRIVRVPVGVPIEPGVPVGCPLDAPPMGTEIPATVRRPTESGAHGAH